MTRIFASAGVLVAALILIGVALAWLVAPALDAAAIKQAVLRDTGRTLVFAGTPRLSLWPELAIELRAVELSNPPEMADGRLVAADTVRLTISAGSLWRSAPEVTEIVAVRPRINLVVDSDGRSNFALEHGEETGTAAPPIVVVDGTVKYLNERSGAAFEATNADVTLARSGLAGPVELDGAFNWNDRRLTLAFHARSSARLAGRGSPADFSLAGPYLSAAFSGRAALRDGLELAGTLEFRAEPLGDLLSWAGIAAGRTGKLPALSASGALDLSGGAIRMSKAELELGRMKAQGDVAFEFGGVTPRVTANLDIDRIDLAVLARDVAGAEAQPAAAWSEAPVDLGFLGLVDAELALAVSELACGALAAEEARLDIGIADGALEAELAEAELYDGPATGRLTLGQTGELIELTATLKASGVNGARLSAGLSGVEQVRGQADLEFDVAAKGASPQELVARLKGEARLSLRDGALVELDVPAMFGHVATEVADGWTAAGTEQTPFSRFEASFRVEDGIAETGDLWLGGPLAEVAGRGSIDLLRRRVDLRVRPQVAGSEKPRSFPVPVVIEGPWSAPKVYPDVDDILEDPAKAYEALRQRMQMDAAKLDLSTRRREKGRSEATATP